VLPATLGVESGRGFHASKPIGIHRRVEVLRGDKGVMQQKKGKVK
jgi:hypothetical protein